MVPTGYALDQNYPNPFNPTTAISYQLSAVSFVKLRIFDVLGNEVGTLVNETKPVGTHTVTFSAQYLPSRVYFYRLSVVTSARRELVPAEGWNGEAGEFVETKKMILLR